MLSRTWPSQRFESRYSPVLSGPRWRMARSASAGFRFEISAWCRTATPRIPHMSASLASNHTVPLSDDLEAQALVRGYHLFEPKMPLRVVARIEREAVSLLRTQHLEFMDGRGDLGRLVGIEGEAASTFRDQNRVIADLGSQHGDAAGQGFAYGVGQSLIM